MGGGAGVIQTALSEDQAVKDIFISIQQNTFFITLGKIKTSVGCQRFIKAVTARRSFYRN